MWKPVHEAHAIERVRLMISFKEAITLKAISAAAEHVSSNHLDWGFDTSERENAVPQELVLMIGADAKPQLAGNEGLVFKKLDGGNIVEEAGFRTGRLGYVTTTYGRWETLEARAQALFVPALDRLKDFADISSLKLEYWDGFMFDGDPAQADALSILADVPLGVPAASQGPGTYWHSHCSWFDVKVGQRFLLNRNINVAPQVVSDTTQPTGLKVHSVVERRAVEDDISLQGLFETLSTMHKIANNAFGEILSEEMRDRIGLNLEEYVVE